MDWTSVNHEKPCVGEEYRYLFRNTGGNIFRGYVYEIDSKQVVIAKNLDKKIMQVVTHWILILDNSWLPDEKKS